jgi:hypothetical protein
LGVFSIKNGWHLLREDVHHLCKKGKINTDIIKENTFEKNGVESHVHRKIEENTKRKRKRKKLAPKNHTNLHPHFPHTIDTNDGRLSP